MQDPLELQEQPERKKKCPQQIFCCTEVVSQQELSEYGNKTNNLLQQKKDDKYLVCKNKSHYLEEQNNWKSNKISKSSNQNSEQLLSSRKLKNVTNNQRKPVLVCEINSQQQNALHVLTRHSFHPNCPCSFPLMCQGKETKPYLKLRYKLSVPSDDQDAAFVIINPPCHTETEPQLKYKLPTQIIQLESNLKDSTLIEEPSKLIVAKSIKNTISLLKTLDNFQSTPTQFVNQMLAKVIDTNESQGKISHVFCDCESPTVNTFIHNANAASHNKRTCQVNSQACTCEKSCCKAIKDSEMKPNFLSPVNVNQIVISDFSNDHDLSTFSNISFRSNACDNISTGEKLASVYSESLVECNKHIMKDISNFDKVNSKIVNTTVVSSESIKSVKRKLFQIAAPKDCDSENDYDYRKSKEIELDHNGGKNINTHLPIIPVLEQNPLQNNIHDLIHGDEVLTLRHKLIPSLTPKFVLCKSLDVHKSSPLLQITEDTMGSATQEIYRYQMTIRSPTKIENIQHFHELSLSPCSPTRVKFGLDTVENQDENIDSSTVFKKPFPKIKMKNKIKNAPEKYLLTNDSKNFLSQIVTPNECLTNSRLGSLGSGQVVQSYAYNLKSSNFDVKDDLFQSSGFKCSRETGLDTQELFCSQKSPIKQACNNLTPIFDHLLFDNNRTYENHNSAKHDSDNLLKLNQSPSQGVISSPNQIYVKNNFQLKYNPVPSQTSAHEPVEVAKSIKLKPSAEMSNSKCFYVATTKNVDVQSNFQNSAALKNVEFALPGQFVNHKEIKTKINKMVPSRKGFVMHATYTDLNQGKSDSVEHISNSIGNSLYCDFKNCSSKFPDKYYSNDLEHGVSTGSVKKPFCSTGLKRFQGLFPNRVKELHQTISNDGISQLSDYFLTSMSSSNGSHENASSSIDNFSDNDFVDSNLSTLHSSKSSIAQNKKKMHKFRRHLSFSKKNVNKFFVPEDLESDNPVNPFCKMHHGVIQSGDSSVDDSDHETIKSMQTEQKEMSDFQFPHRGIDRRTPQQKQADMLVIKSESISGTSNNKAITSTLLYNVPGQNIVRLLPPLQREKNEHTSSLSVKTYMRKAKVKSKKTLRWHGTKKK